MKPYILSIISSLIILSACSGGAKKPQESIEVYHEHEEEGVVHLNALQQETLDLKLGTYEMRNLTTLVKTNGQLEVPPGARAQVTAVIGGNVKSIQVFHGDEVRKGQVLAVLEHPDYVQLQEDFAETASNLEYLKLEFERQKELFDNNVGSGKDYQQTKAQYNAAKARFYGLNARLQLLNLSPDAVINGSISNSIRITAPINGYVNDVNIAVGSYVDAQNELFEILDNSEIHADFMVYEKDIHLLKLGQEIDFTVSNQPNAEYKATIFAIGKSFESDNRAVHIHAQLENAPASLIPGMYVSGHIHANEHYVQTLPDDAIVKEGSQSYIFVVDDAHETEGENQTEDENLELKMMEVVTGQQSCGFTEVKFLTPLDAHTQIALNSAYFLMAELKKGEAEHHH